MQYEKMYWKYKSRLDEQIGNDVVEVDENGLLKNPASEKLISVKLLQVCNVYETMNIWLQRLNKLV